MISEWDDLDLDFTQFAIQTQVNNGTLTFTLANIGFNYALYEIQVQGGAAVYTVIITDTIGVNALRRIFIAGEGIRGLVPLRLGNTVNLTFAFTLAAAVTATVAVSLFRVRPEITPLI